jgi:putative FmdB family regulatory protein
MPIYEYRCGKCQTVIERIHGMKETPAVKCPSCGGRAGRMMSSGAFVLKGSGWYATDYGKKSKMPQACPAAGGGDAPPACEGCPKAAAK